MELEGSQSHGGSRAVGSGGWMEERGEAGSLPQLLEKWMTWNKIFTNVLLEGHFKSETLAHASIHASLPMEYPGQ